MDFTFDIDELEIAVAEGVTASINPWLRVYCSTAGDDVSVNQIDIYTDQKTWVRIDDEPAFKAWEDAIKLIAPKHAPERLWIDQNAEHRLTRSQLGV